MPAIVIPLRRLSAMMFCGQQAAADDVARRRDVDAVLLVGDRLHRGVQRIDPDEVALDDVAGAVGLRLARARRRSGIVPLSRFSIVTPSSVLPAITLAGTGDQPADRVGRCVLDQHAVEQVGPSLGPQDRDAAARPGRPGSRSRRSRPCSPAPTGRGCGRRCPWLPEMRLPAPASPGHSPGRRRYSPRAGARRRRRYPG